MNWRGCDGRTSIFESWSCRPAQRFAVPDMRDWFASGVPGLLRLKGWVRTLDGGWVELQFMGRRGTVRPFTPARAGDAVVVAIGLARQLPRDSLNDRFSHP